MWVDTTQRSCVPVMDIISGRFLCHFLSLSLYLLLICFLCKAVRTNPLLSTAATAVSLFCATRRPTLCWPAATLFNFAMESRIGHRLRPAEAVTVRFSFRDRWWQRGTDRLATFGVAVVGGALYFVYTAERTMWSGLCRCCFRPASRSAPCQWSVQTASVVRCCEVLQGRH